MGFTRRYAGWRNGRHLQMRIRQKPVLRTLIKRSISNCTHDESHAFFTDGRFRHLDIIE